MTLASGCMQLLTLFLLFMLPIPALAIPAITCHCFTERSFEPARPMVADRYFLATAQNSFFALVFNTDKKSLVMKKQQGTSSDDLWIAYWIASRAGKTPDNLLECRQQGDTWKKVIVSLQLSGKIAGTRFSAALEANAADERLSKVVVDDLFFTNRILNEKELSALRKAGATNQELIIAAIIAARTRQSARQLLREVRTGAKSWGLLLSEAKIDTNNLQQEITTILKLHTP